MKKKSFTANFFLALLLSLLYKALWYIWMRRTTLVLSFFFKQSSHKSVAYTVPIPLTKREFCKRQGYGKTMIIHIMWLSSCSVWHNSDENYWQYFVGIKGKTAPGTDILLNVEELLWATGSIWWFLKTS